MKYIASTLILFITLSLSAQNPKRLKFDNFNEVKVFDLIEVNLIKSDFNGVEITGDDVGDVDVVNKDGKLKIRMDIDKIFNGDRTFVSVFYTDLKIIDGNEGAFITSNELITQDNIELRAQEGAQLKIGLDVNRVEIRAVSGGIVETRGKAISQDITLNTGGIYEGKSFETKNTSVNIKAAGEAEVNASNDVDAKVLAGGDIYIYGNPENVREKTTLGGRIKRMN
ncbi:MAG: head GIN domain-containing protein [Bacteroidota bacterium]